MHGVAQLTAAQISLTWRVRVGVGGGDTPGRVVCDFKRHRQSSFSPGVDISCLRLCGVVDYGQSDPTENQGLALKLTTVPLRKCGHHPRVCSAAFPATEVLLGEMSDSQTRLAP